ncbi:MAG: TIGR04086 family membrane protein [Anaerotignum sp.]|nr:TIGR04086 family membrane protein [Anaerotignum sp.]
MNRKEKKTEHKKEKQKMTGNRAFCLIRGMAVAFAITCIIFIGFGILLTYTDISEEHLPLVSLVCTVCSAAVAGYDWAACMKKRGILWGMAAGAVYTAVLFLVTSLAAGKFTAELSSLMILVSAVAGGIVGGIMGVNRK